MSAQFVIVEQRNDWKPLFPDVIVTTAKDYVSQQEYLKLKDIKIINFCRSYRYLSLGYYCSLLAEARKHKIIPTVKTITDLSSKSIYGLNIEDLDSDIQKIMKGKPGNTEQDSFNLNLYFGHCEEKEYQDLGRQIFELYRCPILRVEFRFQGKWEIASIRSGYIQNIPEKEVQTFIHSFGTYSTRRWQNPKSKSIIRYDLAVLHNPDEKLPPSNKRALDKFIQIGRKLGFEVDLIEKRDYSRLAEYDALFIRETTQIDHYTYRFARRAENEGMVVIDDPDSIMKCTNKIYLAELLSAHKIPIPMTKILKKDDQKDILALEAEIPYPIVLKIPDSAFSKGVYKVESSEELKKRAELLFEDSDVILAQEFRYTEFDWRIGILNRKPLFGCQYFMSREHWQIVKHGPSGGISEGDSTTWPIEKVPEEVVETALKAADLIGDGLYGVDLKATNRGVIVMEINDNPNIDVGVEDAHLGDDLYRMILEEFIRRLDLQRAGDKST